MLLGTHLPKKFSVFVIRRFERHIGGVFFKKTSKTFPLTSQLENKMPFGPLFEKKLIIFYLLIDKPHKMHFDGVIFKISAKVFYLSQTSHGNEKN